MLTSSVKDTFHIMLTHSLILDAENYNENYIYGSLK